MLEEALLPEHLRFWIQSVQTGSGLKPLLPTAAAAAAHTLTGFFLTCWVAARLGEGDKSAVLNERPVRGKKQNTQEQVDMRTPCDGGVYFFEFMSCAAWDAALLQWKTGL